MLIHESLYSRKLTTISSNMHIKVIHALCLSRLLRFTRKTIKYKGISSIYYRNSSRGIERVLCEINAKYMIRSCYNSIVARSHISVIISVVLFWKSCLVQCIQSGRNWMSVQIWIRHGFLEGLARRFGKTKLSLFPRDRDSVDNIT